jgi:hypothetical protein
MFFEDAGMGTWSNTNGAVPYTEMNEIFGGWEGVDPEHPRLRR